MQRFFFFIEQIDVILLKKERESIYMMNIDPYSQASLKGVSLPTRIIRSATHEGMADERGVPTKQLIKTYEAYAKGGAGLIITGYMGISQQGKCPLYRMTMLDSDELIPAWREVTDSVHALGTPIFAQIAHSGRQTRKKITGEKTVAPSAIRDFLYWENVPHRLSSREILKIADDFAAAALRAKKAGFDGVQLHCAHGYLLHGFLSPHTNKRRDKWGGSTENRFRIVEEIMRRTRALVGDFPIIVKISSSERDRDGLNPEEAVKISRLMERAGVDGIEVSCGRASEGFNMSRGGFPYPIMCRDNFRFDILPKFTWPALRPFMKMLFKSPEPLRAYNVEAAQMIKRAVSIPVIVCGGIRADDEIRDVICNGKADFVSMSRAFICEANVVNKLRDGTQKEARCCGCNFCLMGAEKRPLRCYYAKLPK